MYRTGAIVRHTARIIACMARRAVIVKLGIDHAGGSSAAGPATRVFADVAAQVAALRAAGTPVVLVSSGAIALGLGTLGRTARPGRLHELQAASAVGQAVLQRRWEARAAKARRRRRPGAPDRRATCTAATAT